MTDLTNILGEIEDGDSSAAEILLPLVYEELRKLAMAKMADERSGHTLQATALVREAYLRLVDVEQAQHWNSRGHFFAAAAEAMRRILVENARRKLRIKHGGDVEKVDLDLTSLKGRPEVSFQIVCGSLSEKIGALTRKMAFPQLIAGVRFVATTNRKRHLRPIVSAL